MKISMIFDDHVSARAAGVLIKRAVSDFEYDLQSFGFDDLQPSGSGAMAAQDVSDTDILVVAVRDDRAFPDHMQFWLGMCFGLRDRDQEGLLVFLSARGADAGPDSSLMDYLRTVAVIGRMAFISQQQSIWRVLTADLVSAS